MTSAATVRGRVVAIAGPTASGKSELAERVAVAFKSEVISIDAMQVYRGMDVGTAKTPADARRCPLRMVDVADIGDDYSVRLFQRDARACVDTLLAAGRIPVLCGGTGLYLNAVIDEMEFPAGQLNSESRKRYEAMAAEQGPQALHDLLAERDPKSAAIIHPNNVRRVVRALEMSDEGRSYAAHHAGLHTRAAHYDTRIWALRMDRSVLYERIDARVDRMFEQGLIAEVEGLVAQGLGDAITALQAIGYKEVVAALDGAMTMDEAREQIKMRTRRYAKRQLSWFRADARVEWLDVEELGMDGCTEAILTSVRTWKEPTSEKGCADGTV